MEKFQPVGGRRGGRGLENRIALKKTVGVQNAFALRKKKNQTGMESFFFFCTHATGLCVLLLVLENEGCMTL